MIKLTLSEVVNAMQGRPWGALPTVSVGGVSTDSRTIKPDELFFALVGPRFDGHDYVAAALQAGAVAAVIAADHAESVDRALRAADLPRSSGALLIEVDNTLAALTRLAAFHRQQLSAEVIAVVGSNGKTTTKAMIHHMLSGQMQGCCSPKSFNNEIGVPLTLLSARQRDEYVVVEIGTNAPGEIATLGEIVQPDMVVLTCVGEEHLEGLGSLAGVIEEECAIFSKLQRGGFAAINIEHPSVQARVAELNVHKATFGRTSVADVRLSEPSYETPWLRFTLNERFPFRLRMVGAHNAINAAGAVTIARRLGMDYAAAAARLESFVPPPMRNELVEVGGVTIVNDAYNANPQSAVAAIDVLEQMPCNGRRVAVFGEMRELGAQSAALHRQVAERLRSGAVQRVILVGVATQPMQDALSGGELFGPSVELCHDIDACIERLAATVQPGDVVLLKASRAVELDKVVEPLHARLTADPVS